MHHPETIAVFIADVLETGDASYIAKALGVVARAQSMSEIARKTGLSREQLYRSLSEERNPTLALNYCCASELLLRALMIN